MSGALRENFYMVKHLKFFTLPIKQEEVSEALEAANMAIQFFHQTHKGGFYDFCDYDGIFWLLAVKKQ